MPILGVRCGQASRRLFREWKTIKGDSVDVSWPLHAESVTHQALSLMSCSLFPLVAVL